MVVRKYKKVCVDGITYEIVPPDGGWGYLIALATTVIYIATVVPIAGFGIIFKDYFASIGDETRGITLTNSIFNTVSFFMGLVANVLLLKISYRKVALIGSCLHVVGTFGTVFVQNFVQSIIFTGIFQGMGFGLLLPSALSAFNEYFNKKLQLWISISQTGMVIGYMLMPPAATWSMQFFGFKGSLLALMVLSLFTFPVSLTFQPVKRHLKMVKVDEDNEMLEKSPEKTIELTRNTEECVDSNSNVEITSGPTEKASFCRVIINSLSLLKDPKYLNICVGLALCFTADIAFYPLIPLVLAHVNYSTSDVATIMSVYFGADLVTRMLLSIVSYFVSFKSRKLFYFGALFSAIFRIGWLMHNAFWWKISIMAILGAFRAFIETLVSLVISEEYQNKFATAFSLYMVANGTTCLLCGTIMSYVKSYTNSDVMTCHVLTAAFLVTIISWSIEWCIVKKKK